MKNLIATLCLAALPFSYAAAEGYQVNAQSTKQAGMGHVGAAMKLGAESMHFNPAGLVFMDKSVDLSVGVSGVFAHAKFENGDYEAKNDVSPSTPLYVYAGFKIYDNLAAGVSINTPYGSGITWGDNWKGSHLIQEISLKAFNIQPTISWKITDKLSIGAGLMMEFGNIQLNRAVIGPGISADAFEVGDEVYAQFATAGFDMGRISHRTDKWHIDLWECNRLQLIEAGLEPASVAVAGICTYNNADDFFSARRLGTASGRIFTGIIIRQGQ